MTITEFITMKPRVNHYEITTERGTFKDWAIDKKEAKKRAAEICRKFGNTLGNTVLKIERI